MSNGSLTNHVSCTVELTTFDPAKSGVLGQLGVCDSRGFVCNVSIEVVQIKVNSMCKFF